VATIEPCCLLGCKEKLRTIGVFASIGHREPSHTIVLQLEVFIRESVTINAPATCAILVGEISSLTISEYLDFHL